ncbi:hypothetical protein QWJ90_04505 [Microbacterium oryzae]|nr:hypothetical protein [Microbacterium oryzae]MDN3310182.1 hypothetical protein [Microbacterium oryzae]
MVRCRDDLASATRHPLLRAMTRGRVTTGEFQRYAELESTFVTTALGLAERARDEERDPAVRRRLDDIVADLAGPQHDYFRRLAEDGVAAPIAGPRTTDPLTAYVTALAVSHGAPAIAVCFAAAETLYAIWCAAAARRPRPRPQAVQAWIDMHATVEFAAQAQFWRSLVDRLPIGEVDDATLDAWFLGALEAENRFHDAAYEKDAA